MVGVAPVIGLLDAKSPTTAMALFVSEIEELVREKGRCVYCGYTLCVHNYIRVGRYCRLEDVPHGP